MARNGTEQEIIDPGQAGETDSQTGNGTDQPLGVDRDQGAGDHQGYGEQKNNADHTLGGKKGRSSGRLAD
jgi:hypothetical protein